ncbi:MAG: zinc-binding dehydrogenase, partial [Cryobacterium sp.]|nr:zinc-binding dehydrogenase [Cryobacterium sp.]
VIACGEEVTAFEVGDRVMGLLDHRGGGQSDYVTMAQRRIALVPADLPDVAAAALPLAGLTALQALRTRGHLRAGNGGKVLINGAAGGIGSFAVQLAKLSGAHVTAVTSGDRHNYLQGLGADNTVDRGDGDTFRSGQGFDLILDVPGVLRFTNVRAALNPHGVLVSTRPITTDALRLAHPSTRAVSRTPRYAAVTTKATSQDLSYLARLVHEGRLTVPVDATFPLAEASAAYAHAESGEVKGKVVLTL